MGISIKPAGKNTAPAFAGAVKKSEKFVY